MSSHGRRVVRIANQICVLATGMLLFSSCAHRAGGGVNYRSLEEAYGIEAETISPLYEGQLHTGQRFQVRIPDGFILNSERQADFYSYTVVSSDGVVLLDLFDPSFPKFPLLDEATGEVEQFFLNGMRVDSMRWIDNDGKHNREVLVYLFYRHRTMVPRFLHVIYTDLNGNEKETADAIISTIQGYNLAELWEQSERIESSADTP